MAISKFEDIGELLLINNFKEEIPEEFHCIICKIVSIETFTAYCECRFCCACIKEYLKDESKYCPGIKNECKEEYLEIDVNVSKDVRTIRSIERISLKCPNEMCEVRCDVRNMSNHLRVCGMSTSKCPYENIGCQVRQICKDNVKIHYDNEWLTHSQLIVEAIDNLRNDVNELKNVVARRDEQIITLTENDERKEEMIEELKQQIKNQSRDIDELKVKDDRRDREMEVMKETQKKTMMEELDNLKKEFVEINLIQNTQKKTMMEEFKNVKKDIVEMDVRGDIKDQKNSLDDLKENQENIKREISSVIMKVRDSRIYDEREFIWRVDNFSQMRDDYSGVRNVILRRYSLKLWFTVWCEGDYLGFDCRILKGECDDYIIWPMKHKITLSMINQDTTKVHKSREFHFESSEGDKSAFDKPKNEGWNDYFGDNNFMTVKDLSDSPGLLLNDSLIVSLNIDY